MKAAHPDDIQIHSQTNSIFLSIDVFYVDILNSLSNETSPIYKSDVHFDRYLVYQCPVLYFIKAKLTESLHTSPNRKQGPTPFFLEKEIKPCKIVTKNKPIILYLSNYFHFEVMKQKESSCNHKEKEIVFENLISFLYQIAPIKCKWCEIIPFFIFIFTSAHKILTKIKLSIYRMTKHNLY